MNSDLFNTLPRFQFWVLTLLASQILNLNFRLKVLYFELNWKMVTFLWSGFDYTRTVEGTSGSTVSLSNWFCSHSNQKAGRLLETALNILPGNFLLIFFALNWPYFCFKGFNLNMDMFIRFWYDSFLLYFNSLAL